MNTGESDNKQCGKEAGALCADGVCQICGNAGATGPLNESRMLVGWLCTRCGASNSPMVHKCSCVPEVGADIMLSAEVLKHISKTLSHKYRTVSKVNYTHPVTKQNIVLDFDNQLRIWRGPESGHAYSIGVDVSSGENDHSSLVVIDYDFKEQVAEMILEVLPNTLAMMIDYLGRLYNDAFIIPDRTGLGICVCQSCNDVAYNNIYKMETATGEIGFLINMHRPQLNNNLLNYLGEGGVIIYSRRIFAQLNIYRGSHIDGLVAATALALIHIDRWFYNTNKSIIDEYQCCYCGGRKVKYIGETPEQCTERFDQGIQVSYQPEGSGTQWIITY